MEKFILDSRTKILFDKDDWKVIENGVTQDTNRNSLYKYFSLNEFSLDSLENDYVYLSNPKDFNDPFDCNRNLIIENYKTEMEQLERNVLYFGRIDFIENIKQTQF